MSNKETMTDVAYNFMVENKGEISFLQLWQNVCDIMKIPADKQRRKKSQFYSELMLDNRFASLEGNQWDLRNRRKFDELHNDSTDIDMDDDDEDIDTTDQDNSLDTTDQENENNKY